MVRKRTNSGDSDTAEDALGPAMLELRAAANSIWLVLRYFPMTPAAPDWVFGQTPHEDMKLLLSQLLVVYLHRFLDSLAKVERFARSVPGGTDALRQLKPLTRALRRKGQVLSAYRNKLIAHPRALTSAEHPLETMLRHNVPLHYGELLFLGRIALELMRQVRGVFASQLECAQERILERQDAVQVRIAEKEAGERIKSPEDLDRAVAELLAQLDGRDAEG